MNDAGKADSGSDTIRAAQKLLKQSRQQGLAALNELGQPSKPLDGFYDGELVAVDIAPVITQFVEFITSFWRPWKGKHLIKDESKGDNIFGGNSRLILRIIYPFYKGIVENDKETFLGFVFQTSIAPGKTDPDRQVFKIDYASPVNPALTVRRILDEVVQADDGLYVGKIHSTGGGVAGQWSDVFPYVPKDQSHCCYC